MKKILILMALCALAVPTWAIRDFDFQDSVRVAGSITVYDTGATQSVIDSINRLISESLAVVIIDSALYADSSGVAKALTAQTFIRSTTCSTRVAWAESIKANGPLYLWSKADSIIALEAVHLRQDTVYSGNMVVRDTLDAAYGDIDTLLGKTVNKGVLEATDSVKAGTVTRAPVGSFDTTKAGVISSSKNFEVFFAQASDIVGGAAGSANLEYDTMFVLNSGSNLKDTLLVRTTGRISNKKYGTYAKIDTIMLRFYKTNDVDTVHFFVYQSDSVSVSKIDSAKVVGGATTGSIGVKVNSAMLTLSSRPIYFIIRSYCKTAVTDLKYMWIRVVGHY